jgi:hypothetical protein
MVWGDPQKNSQKIKVLLPELLENGFNIARSSAFVEGVRPEWRAPDFWLI